LEQIDTALGDGKTPGVELCDIYRSGQTQLSPLKLSLAGRTGDPDDGLIVTLALRGDPNLVAILPVRLGADVLSCEAAHAQTPASAESWPLTSGHSLGRTVIAVGAACDTTGEAGELGRESDPDEET
jgi:hypothetical protein